MTEITKIKSEIIKAFKNVKYPGDDALRGSSIGQEPFILEQMFAGKNNWQELDPEFIDSAPDGLGSALNFFSDEAFHFYLPAYLIADLDGLLDFSDPIFYLIHGFDQETRNKEINSDKFGELTWTEVSKKRFKNFTKEQAKAIIAFLKFKQNDEDLAEFEVAAIKEAISFYWSKRAK